MTKAKKFIQDYKRDYSNTNVGWNDNGEEVTWYSLWLSPDDAVRAVEIEREEMIDKAWDWVENNILSSNQQDKSRSYFEQFKNHMKGE